MQRDALGRSFESLTGKEKELHCFAIRAVFFFTAVHCAFHGTFPPSTAEVGPYGILAQSSGFSRGSDVNTVWEDFTEITKLLMPMKKCLTLYAKYQTAMLDSLSSSSSPPPPSKEYNISFKRARHEWKQKIHARTLQFNDQNSSCPKG